MIKRNKKLLILAQKEVMRILKGRKISELTMTEKILANAYLTTMKDIYNQPKIIIVD